MLVHPCAFKSIARESENENERARARENENERARAKGRVLVYNFENYYTSDDAIG